MRSGKQWQDCSSKPSRGGGSTPAFSAAATASSYSSSMKASSQSSGSGAYTMSRLMLKSTALPVSRLMLATIITSVRRLQRPGPASPPASRMVRRPSRRSSSKGASYQAASSGVITGRTGLRSSSGSHRSLAHCEAFGGRVEGVIRGEVGRGGAQVLRADPLVDQFLLPLLQRGQVVGDGQGLDRVDGLQPVVEQDGVGHD